MNILLVLLMAVFISIIIYLDVKKKISVTNKKVMSIYLILAPHIILLEFSLTQFVDENKTGVITSLLLILEMWIIVLYIWFRLSIKPIFKENSDNTRLNIMMGGRKIILCGLYSYLVQLAIGIYIVETTEWHYVVQQIIILEILIAILISMFLLLNGILRIMCTSKTLGRIKKCILLFTSWIPIVNIFVIFHVCRIVSKEYIDNICEDIIDSILKV